MTQVREKRGRIGAGWGGGGWGRCQMSRYKGGGVGERRFCWRPCARGGVVGMPQQQRGGGNRRKHRRGEETVGTETSLFLRTLVGRLLREKEGGGPPNAKDGEKNSLWLARGAGTSLGQRRGSGENAED